MPPAQLPEVAEVLVGAGTSTALGSEGNLGLHPQISCLGSRSELHPTCPTSGWRPGGHGPVQAVAVDVEWGEIAPAVGLGGEGGAVAEAGGEGSVEHGEGKATTLRRCRRAFCPHHLEVFASPKKGSILRMSESTFE